MAKDVAHTVDVDGMLSAMTPQEFDEWVVMYTIWGEQQQSGSSKQDSLATFRGLAGV